MAISAKCRTRDRVLKRRKEAKRARDLQIAAVPTTATSTSMNPKSRKRDRVLKRRKEAKLTLEKEMKSDERLGHLKRVQTTSSADEKTPQCEEDGSRTEPPTQKSGVDNASHVTTSFVGTEEEKKIERQRLKNQQRKLLRKKKKECKAKTEVELCALKEQAERESGKQHQ
jgi:hypothetical protein